MNRVYVLENQAKLSFSYGAPLHSEGRNDAV
jgi:hypothetical protein